MLGDLGLELIGAASMNNAPNAVLQSLAGGVPLYDGHCEDLELGAFLNQMRGF